MPAKADNDDNQGMEETEAASQQQLKYIIFQANSPTAATFESFLV